MQKQLLISCFTLLCVFLSLTASAQFVIVNSPPSIAGSKVYATAAFGAAVNTGTWTADAVFVDNGTATPTLGCGSVVNAAAVAGKIALIDRGTCSFSEKAHNAEVAGAIAVIIFNHTAGAGAAGMAATAGFDVTIPTVGLSYEDGQAIRAELANGPVNITIGNVVFLHNLHISYDRVTVPFNGAMPTIESEASTDVFTPAVEVQNLGSEDATGVTVSAVITFTPAGGGASTQVYSESASATAAIPQDSVEAVALPTYVPTEGEGTYHVVYTVSGDVDDDAVVNDDQVVETDFYLTDNLYSKGRYDVANDRPIKTTAYTTATARDNEYIAPFEVPKGAGYKLDSLVFYAESSVSFGSNDATLEAWVYDWTDLNEDSTITDDEVTIVGYVPSDFMVVTDTAATSQWFKVPIIQWEDLETEGYVIPGDNKRYLVGLRYTTSTATDYYRVGFDEQYDQTVNLNYGLALYDTHIPYIGVTAWANNAPDWSTRFRFTDFWGSLSTGLIINPYETPSTEVSPVEVAVTLSPNPASSQLVVESKLKSATGNISYTIRDNTGRMVYTGSKMLNTDYDKASFDVSQFATGQYFIVITTDNGIKAERFSVQH